MATVKEKDHDETTTIGVIIARKYVDRIDKWAEKLRHSRSKMARIVLEAAIEDEGWMWGLMSSGPSRALVSLLFGKDFSKPIDDEDKQFLGRMVLEVSTSNLAEISALCQEELKRRKTRAA